MVERREKFIRNSFPPDTFRLRYRQALSAAFKAIIFKRQFPTEETVTSAIPSEVGGEGGTTKVCSTCFGRIA